MRALTAVTLLAAALAGAPAAGADPAADQYLAELHAAGIGYEDPRAALDVGNAVCDLFRAHMRYIDVADNLMSIAELTFADAQTIIANATTYLCPGVVIT